MSKDYLHNNTEYLYGLNTIRSLIDVNAGNRKIKRLLRTSEAKKSKRVAELISLAKDNGIEVTEISNEELSKISEKEIPGEDSGKDQGLLAEVSPYNYSDLDHFLDRDRTGDTALVMLDGVTDIGNFSSILRNCSAFGVEGVIIPSHRSVKINNRVSKVSSGALEEIKVFLVKNLNNTIRKLKEHGYWIYGSSLKKDISSPIDDIDFSRPLVLVMGSEHKGISRLVEKNCDVLVNIPQRGKMQSLNVSVASGIFLYHLQRKK